MGEAIIRKILRNHSVEIIERFGVTLANFGGVLAIEVTPEQAAWINELDEEEN